MEKYLYLISISYFTELPLQHIIEKIVAKDFSSCLAVFLNPIAF